MQPDTEWETYMAHGAAFLRGERDYAVLRGDSARAVGPAGYVYLCAALHRLTAGGAHLVRAQALWAVRTTWGLCPAGSSAPRRASGRGALLLRTGALWAPRRRARPSCGSRAQRPGLRT